MKNKSPKRNEAEHLDSHLETYIPFEQESQKLKKKNNLIESDQALEIQYELDIINQFKAADPIADFAKKYKCDEEEVVKMISEWKKRNRR
jgi:Mor family transcriptional regulator